ncbi:MAG: hypothetical protein SGBAC_012946 [Bacillariaceae sp.]
MSDDRLERLQAIGFLWEQPEDDDGMESAEEPNDETDSSHNDSDDSEYDEDGSHRTVRNSGHEGPSWMELSRRCATQKKEVEQLKAKESACRTLIKQHKKEITLLSCMNQDLMQTSHDVMECNQNLRESHRIAMLEERVHIGRECKKRKLVETKLETSKHQSKETIQKLHSERLTLQSTNASLENENEDLRNRNKELEKRLEILERDNQRSIDDESKSLTLVQAVEFPMIPSTHTMCMTQASIPTRYRGRGEVLMTQIELCLVPAPGQKPEFLAILEPLPGSPPLWLTSKVSKIVLENYTRDSWAMDTAAKWHTLQFQSIDGRQKLPGFHNYLRERKKSAFGKFGGDKVIVVPHKQMSSKTITCRVANLNELPGCPIQPKTKVPPPSIPQPAAANSVPPKITSSGSNVNPPKKKKAGLLGNLVGAQQRTNHQVITSKAPKPQSEKPPAQSSFQSQGGATTPSTGGEPFKTAAQVLMDFRQEMEQEMLDFDISPEPQLKVKLSLASKTKLLSEEDKVSGKVSMEVLKYIVYEAAEEVNEEWIAHKEPSEFMDEVVISIYKEGEAPPDVIEDINKAELPDEIIGQQRALQQQQQRLNASRNTKDLQEKQRLAMAQDFGEDVAVLNTNKRDRRSIEEIQAEMQDPKRQRSS